jgi:hypothetical protein
MLTPDLLERLEFLWRTQQAPVADRLQPGLSEAALDELTSPVGIRLPTEARMWWQWHNGAAPDLSLAARRELGPGFAFLPLEEAVVLVERLRTMAQQVWAPEGQEAVDYWWRPTWFPITERRGAVRLDCAVPDGEPCPVYWAYSHDHDADGLTTPKVTSLGTMIGWWIEALENGAWRYNTENSRWQYHPELIDAERERSGLV